MIQYLFRRESLLLRVSQKYRGDRLLQRLPKSRGLVSSQCPRRIKYKRIQLQSFLILAVMWPRATMKKRKIRLICFSKPFSTMEYPFIINVFARKLFDLYEVFSQLAVWSRIWVIHLLYSRENGSMIHTQTRYTLWTRISGVLLWRKFRIIIYWWLLLWNIVLE